MARRFPKIRGTELEKLRNRAALTQKELGDKLGVAERTVGEWERRGTGMRQKSLRALADVFKIELEALRQRIVAEEPAGGFDVNVEPYSESAMPVMPLFDLPLAAGDWMDVPSLCESPSAWFKVQLRGDSMKPVYPDSSIVVFRCLRADQEGPIEGKDYYVQRNDGTATFKRVAKIEEDAITLQALNSKQRPRFMVVPKQEVVRMAVAEHKVDTTGMHGGNGNGRR